jgi:hypothetical protein
MRLLLPTSLAKRKRRKRFHAKTQTTQRGERRKKEEKKEKRGTEQGQRLWTWDLLRASQVIVRIARALERGFQEPGSFLFPFDRKSALFFVLSLFCPSSFSSLRRLRLCARLFFFF